MTDITERITFPLQPPEAGDVAWLEGRGYFGTSFDGETFDPDVAIRDLLPNLPHIMWSHASGMIDGRRGLHPWGVTWAFLYDVPLDDPRIDRLASFVVMDTTQAESHLSAPMVSNAGGLTYELPAIYQSRMRTYRLNDYDTVKLHAKEHTGASRKLIGTSLYFSRSDA